MIALVMVSIYSTPLYKQTQLECWLSVLNQCLIFTDVDECADGTNGCAQLCTNVIGSYVCACDTGYRLASDGRWCTDINECFEGTDRCNHTCTNSIGTYACSCKTGYGLARDGRTCNGKSLCKADNCSYLCYSNVIDNFTDINECAEGNDRCAQTCTNHNGGYSCSCTSGYRLMPNGRGCEGVLICVMI